MFFWDCLWMIGLLYSYWSYWMRQSQSDKTVFALRRSPLVCNYLQLKLQCGYGGCNTGNGTMGWVGCTGYCSPFGPSFHFLCGIHHSHTVGTVTPRTFTGCFVSSLSFWSTLHSLATWMYVIKQWDVMSWWNAKTKTIFGWPKSLNPPLRRRMMQNEMRWSACFSAIQSF